MTKTKLLSCIGISRARMKYDKDYVDQLCRKVYGITDSKAIDYTINKKLLSIGVGKCLGEISEEHARTLMAMIQKKRQIDPFIKEHRDLLGLEEIENDGLPDGHEKRINKVNMMLAEIENEYKDSKDGSNSHTDNNDSHDDDDDNEEDFLSYFFNKTFLLFRILGIDGYIGLTLLFVLFFLGIRHLRLIYSKKQYKIKQSKNKSNE